MLFSREIDIKEDRKSFDQKRSILVIGKGMNQYSYILDDSLSQYDKFTMYINQNIKDLNM